MSDNVFCTRFVTLLLPAQLLSTNAHICDTGQPRWEEFAFLERKEIVQTVVTPPTWAIPELETNILCTMWYIDFLKSSFKPLWWHFEPKPHPELNEPPSIYTSSHFYNFKPQRLVFEATG